MEQIQAAEEKLHTLKEDIQLANQKFMKNGAAGLDPKGPLSRVLSTLQDAEFFFDQFLKCQGIKYLPPSE